MAVIKKNPYRQDTPKIKEHLEQRAINSFKRRMSKMMKFKCHNLGWGHWGSFGK